MIPARWLRTADELRAFVASLGGVRRLGLDSEADGLHHYAGRTCLVQLATDRGDAVLIDPIAVPDLSPLAPVLGDPGVRKVLHGADHDVTTLKRDFGFAFPNMGDTMLAARFLGRTEIGLLACVRDELGATLSKAHQKDDWSARPLRPEQEQYALKDVVHLLDLEDRFAARLRELGRHEWWAEESEAVAAMPPARRGPEPDAWMRIKGAGKLPPRALAVLREAWNWREELARRRDVPPFKIVGNELLLELAQAPPRSRDELRRHRGVLPRLQAEVPALLAGVERALALPEAELPRFPRPPRAVVSEATERRIDALRAWRQRRSAELGLPDVSVLLPQRLLEKVAEANPADARGLEAVEGLRRWRVDSFGDELLAALRSAP
ncbi:MAG: HRDC domain-containing protein [Vicinamibacteria bacterium]|nr:HRDC domain-containing protein [Vicinamibacteria bacterium]